MKFEKLFNNSKYVYDFLRKSYMTLFIFAVLTRVLMPIALRETQFINDLVFSSVAIFGAFVLLFDLFTRRIMLTSKNVFWLLGFLLVCIISSIINVKYGLYGNIKNAVWLAISFFFFFFLDKERSLDEVKKEIKYVSNVLIAVWFAACSVSLTMFLFQMGYYVDVYPNSFSRQGFIEGRLFGIFEDPNFAAVVAIIVIILSIFNLFTISNRLLKAFYIISIIINFLYVVLSGSRTAEVAFAVTVLISSYFILKKKDNLRKVNLIIKQVIMVITSLICSAILLLSISITRKGLSYIPSFIDSPFTKTGNLENRIKKPVDTTREDIGNGADISNCRFKIWVSALELFKSKPIFGTSPRNMRIYAKTEFPHGFIAKRSYAVHNAYIDVLTSTGIVGATCILVFFLKYLYDIFKYLFSSCKSDNYYIVLFNVSIVSTVAVAALFLSEIFFVNTIGVLMFWSNLGYSYYFMKESKS